MGDDMDLMRGILALAAAIHEWEEVLMAQFAWPLAQDPQATEHATYAVMEAALDLLGRAPVHSPSGPHARPRDAE
jgi:hypothetical protein